MPLTVWPSSPLSRASSPPTNYTWYFVYYSVPANQKCKCKYANMLLFPAVIYASLHFANLHFWRVPALGKNAICVSKRYVVRRARKEGWGSLSFRGATKVHVGIECFYEVSVLVKELENWQICILCKNVNLHICKPAKTKTEIFAFLHLHFCRFQHCWDTVLRYYLSIPTSFHGEPIVAVATGERRGGMSKENHGWGPVSARENIYYATYPLSLSFRRQTVFYSDAFEGNDRKWP